MLASFDHRQVIRYGGGQGFRQLRTASFPPRAVLSKRTCGREPRSAQSDTVMKPHFCRFCRSVTSSPGIGLVCSFFCEACGFLWLVLLVHVFVCESGFCWPQRGTKSTRGTTESAANRSRPSSQLKFNLKNAGDNADELPQGRQLCRSDRGT